MQQVQLDALRPALTDVASGLHHLRIRLPRQAEDLVHNDLQTGRAEAADRIVKHRQVVAAADIGRALRMDGLQAELDPDGLFRVQPLQQCDHRIRQAVRPRGDRQRRNILRRKRLCEQALHARDAAISVREVLKISNVFATAVFTGHARLGCLNLLRNVQCAVSGEGTGTVPGAENTAARTDSPVPVRTGKAAVERELIDLAAEAAAQLLVQSVIIHSRKRPGMPGLCVYAFIWRLRARFTIPSCMSLRFMSIFPLPKAAHESASSTTVVRMPVSFSTSWSKP